MNSRLLIALLLMTACSDPIDEQLEPARLDVQAQISSVYIGDSVTATALVTDNGRPVPDVEVHWITFHAIPPLGAYPMAEFVRNTPLPIRTDANGRASIVIVPVTQGAYEVIASAGVLSDTANFTTEYSRGVPTARRWEALPDMPSGRWDAAAATVGDRIYLIGGRANEPGNCAPCTPVMTTLVFDVPTQTWTVAAHPIVVNTFNGPDIFGVAATLNQQIHFISGTRHFVYTPANDVWSERAAAAPDATDGMLHAVNGQLYLVRSTGAMHVYDPDPGLWSVRQPLSPPRRAAASTVANGQIYVAGGLTIPSAPSSCSDHSCWHTLFTRYDPGSDSWTNLTPMPFPRLAFGAGVVGGSICVFGGAYSFPRSMWPFTETYCFDPAAGEWVLDEGFVFSGAVDFTSVQHGDAVYAFGGRLKLGSLLLWQATSGTARLSLR